jgi:hypothetical protein
MGIFCHDFMRNVGGWGRWREAWFLLMGKFRKDQFPVEVEEPNRFGIFAQSYVLKIGTEPVKDEVQMSC